MKPIDKRKVIGTVIGIIFFISCLAYFTYAWYEWRSGNNTVNLTIKDSTANEFLKCTFGPEVNVKNIGPVLNVSDGVKTNFTVKNEGEETATISLGINIESISSKLLESSFKWALFKNETGQSSFDYSNSPLLSGNFSNLSIGNNNLSSSLTIVGKSTYSFQFIVYIDGNVPNPESMMQGSMNAVISYGECNGTIEDNPTPPASSIKLTEGEVGAYVNYVGNNGCLGSTCSGQNANYISETNKGYCVNSSYKYNSTGWRIGYILENTAYLISAGSPECLCTDNNGTSSTNCSSYETTSGLPEHIANLNKKALTYCNSTFAYGGVCNTNSAWNIADADFKKITGEDLNTATTRGDNYYDNYSLINTGGFYWFATNYSSSPIYPFYWEPSYHYVAKDITTKYAIGVRPVLRLKESTIITGGDGSEDTPYTIDIINK